MTVFLIVLIAILVICCGIMLYLYFSVRKEADSYEHEYRRYSELYSKAQKLALELGSEKDNLEGVLEQTKIDYLRRIRELYEVIDSLRQQLKGENK